MTEVWIQSSQIEFINEMAWREHKLLEEICVQFVDDVIGRVVGECEEESAKLARFLDKEKMWNTLRSLVDQINGESLIQSKLEKIVAEHFLRKSDLCMSKHQSSSMKSTISDLRML